ncbi:WD domain, G-beta repeat-containing protein [Besnoitia besnoiti]|uniref:WD domain, G-beta repeat-containing protein n=1 Tax=Besnoitia besnoiti TaxID=94643 RepID=A0A2A9MEA0_BESBE|nr:WD domain, G-beta repeat-containing protein [Besnoitia besnoiti]PFH35524.1 WD domain, G-beta repeat-containing protein [Besnoitia besnoiti]
MEDHASTGRPAAVADILQLGNDAETVVRLEGKFLCRDAVLSMPSVRLTIPSTGSVKLSERSSAAANSDVCYIHELHDEVIFILMSFLGRPETAFHTIGSLSRRLRTAVTNEELWQEFFARRFKGKLNSPSTWRYSRAEVPPVRPALPLWLSLSPTPHSQTTACSSPTSSLPAPSSSGACRHGEAEGGSQCHSPECRLSPLWCSDKLLPTALWISLADQGDAGPPTCATRDSVPESAFEDSRCVAAEQMGTGVLVSSLSPRTRSMHPPYSSHDTSRVSAWPPSMCCFEQVFSPRRSSPELALDSALECMGVPSGGKCWRGKYLLKHSLERKFARGQFDMQRTWFVGHPTLRPAGSGSGADALNDPSHWSHASVASPRSKLTDHSSGKRGILLERKDTLSSSCVLSKLAYLHHHHPRHLCHFQHLRSRRHSNGHDLAYQPRLIGALAASPGVCTDSSPAGPPPVCVLSLRFFCDGAGLLYAARAGGVGAFCPDRGCHLRTFALRREVRDERAGSTRARSRVDRRVRAGSVVRRRVTHNRRDGLLMQHGSHSETGTDEHDSVEEDRLQKEGAEHAGRTEGRGQVHASDSSALALCVAHTIDDALSRCGDFQDRPLACRRAGLLAETVNFERQRPLVVGGYSDGKVGVWDYCHPERVLETLEVTAQLHRGRSAVKSVCAVAGGFRGGGGCDILAGAEDGGVALLTADRADIGVIQRLRGHTAAIQSIACDTHSGIVFTASRDRFVHVFDIRAGELPVASCGRHDDWAMCVHITDGLGDHVFETADRAVHTWDLRRLIGDGGGRGGASARTATALVERHRHKQLISGMRLDAFRLVSCSLDGCVLLSSLENRSLSTPGEDTVPQHTDFSVLRQRGETQWMLGVDFAETKMVTATVDGAIQIYHLLHLHTLPGCFVYN